MLRMLFLVLFATLLDIWSFIYKQWIISAAVIVNYGIIRMMMNLQCGPELSLKIGDTENVRQYDKSFICFR